MPRVTHLPRVICHVCLMSLGQVVCMSVLSCPLLVCPPLDNVLARCFPYTTLNNLDFLNIDGFVAGTTNPIFESHAEWWDVLCDLDSGKV